MRINNYLPAFLFSVLTAAVSSCSPAGSPVILINTIAVDRPDALIVLKRADVTKKLGGLAAGKYITVTTAGNKVLPVQFDDPDKDGTWDEAVFQYTFGPNEQAKVYLAITDQAPAATSVRAHVRLRKRRAAGTYGAILVRDTMPYRLQANDFAKTPIPYYQTEGPAWENDKVAFRLYFDVRNAKDLFGKTTPKMMMDTVGVEGDIHYHQKADWGMDILKVGRSLGAGSIAIKIPFNGKDTIIRPGGDSTTLATYECIADGPIRAMLHMRYHVLLPGGTLADVTEEISIWGGQYFYESRVTATGLPEGSRLVTGIVNLHSKNVNLIDTGGSNTEYTYAVQSENNDKLGMAIMARYEYFDKFATSTNDSTANIQHTYLLYERPSAGNLGVFRCYFGWQPTDKMFATEAAFAAYLKTECVRNGKDVEIKW